MLCGGMLWYFRSAQFVQSEECRGIVASLEASEAKFRSVAEAAGGYIWE